MTKLDENVKLWLKKYSGTLSETDVPEIDRRDRYLINFDWRFNPSLIEQSSGWKPVSSENRNEGFHLKQRLQLNNNLLIDLDYSLNASSIDDGGDATANFRCYISYKEDNIPVSAYQITDISVDVEIEPRTQEYAADATSVTPSERVVGFNIDDYTVDLRSGRIQFDFHPHLSEIPPQVAQNLSEDKVRQFCEQLAQHFVDGEGSP